MGSLPKLFFLSLPWLLVTVWWSYVGSHTCVFATVTAMSYPPPKKKNPAFFSTILHPLTLLTFLPPLP